MTLTERFGRAAIRAAILLFVALLACGEVVSPRSAAESFYRAVNEGDEERIGAACDSIGGAIPLDNFFLGLYSENPEFRVDEDAKPDLHGDLAVVPAVVAYGTDPLRFRTYLVAEPGGWKVLMGFTGVDLKVSILQAALIAIEETIGDAEHKLQRAVASENESAASALSEILDSLLSSRQKLQEQLIEVRSILQSGISSRFPDVELTP